MWRRVWMTRKRARTRSSVRWLPRGSAGRHERIIVTGEREVDFERTLEPSKFVVVLDGENGRVLVINVMHGGGRERRRGP
jgi:hypothetical protein